MVPPKFLRLKTRWHPCTIAPVLVGECENAQQGSPPQPTAPASGRGCSLSPSHPTDRPRTERGGRMANTTGPRPCGVAPGWHPHIHAMVLRSPQSRGCARIRGRVEGMVEAALHSRGWSHRRHRQARRPRVVPVTRGVDVCRAPARPRAAAGRRERAGRAAAGPGRSAESCGQNRRISVSAELPAVASARRGRCLPRLI